MQKAGVDLAPAIRNDETAEALNPVSKAEKTIRLKARFSLIVIWISASVVCLFFVLFSFTTTPLPSYITNTLLLNKLPKSLLPVGTAGQQQINDAGEVAGENDAFVFVNFDKHFFLTHFPSGVREGDKGGELNGNDLTTPAGSGSRVSIIRKARPVQKNKSNTVDFDVKPVPQ